MKIRRTIAGILCVALLVAACVTPVFAYAGRISKETVAQAAILAEQIEAEGIVLLQNENKTLPLAEKKVNVFGANSAYQFLGGVGSGAITTKDPIDFYDALTEEGIEFNTELKELYEKLDSNSVPVTQNSIINNLLGLLLQPQTIDEVSPSKIGTSVLERAKEFSDTAIIMVGRGGKENSDLTAEELSLNEQEAALVEFVTSNFGNVIVIFNTATTMEMGWLDSYESIHAAAMVWLPGEFGMRAVAKMFTGEVNPSGHLADSISYHISDHPSNENFGDCSYEGSSESFVDYKEGIYVGYRYFETFAPEKVQFPFGFGLSYTDFEWELISSDANGDEITAEVRVKNIGAAAGKDVVQLYYTAPYTPGGTEKSAIVLGAFAKTKMLAPGEADTLTLTFATRDMSSYDNVNKQAWVLDKGEYKLSIRKDIRSEEFAFTYTAPETVVYKTDEVTGTTIANLFDDAYDGFTLLSRSNPTGTYPSLGTKTATQEIKNVDGLPEPIDGDIPVTGAEYDKVITLADVAADEGLWDKFLDQLTVSEMIKLVGCGGYGTEAVERLGIPQTFDNDGPSSVKGMNGVIQIDSGVAYPCETTIACTWNTELAEEMGVSVGGEAKEIGTHIWYAPGANIHRNPRGGRNFEYFSEDALLSGKMAAAITRGAQSQNLVVTVKHFALNDQETNRTGVFTWATEQTMREIYFKPFEIAVKEGGAVGMMSAFNRLGTVWCGASSPLLNDLLREEWGFEGYVVSDYSNNFTGTGYMNPAIAVYNGTMLTGIWGLQQFTQLPALRSAYNNDPVGMGNALRAAVKNLCIAKMHTNAFLHPELTYDNSLSSYQTPIDEWEFSFPYVFSGVLYVLNSGLNAVIYLLKFIL